MSDGAARFAWAEIARRAAPWALRALVLAAVLFAAGKLRLAVVSEYHVPAGDGLEYHQLAHELKLHGRYGHVRSSAFGEERGPSKLAWGRMPGYPLLLSKLVEEGKPADIEKVLERGTHWNVAFDLATLLLLFFIAWEAFGERAAWPTLAVTSVWPLLLLNCCYLLRETFATTLTAATFYLLVLALRRRWRWTLVVAGALTGATMLVRSDAVVWTVAFLPPWWVACRSLRWPSRIAWGAAAAFACAAVFAPWPLRNLRELGEMHPLAASWVDQNGEPIPTGERAWMRTWVDDIDEGYINIRFVRHLSVARKDIDARAWDTGDELEELLQLIGRYNRDGLTPQVDEGFRVLARQRIHRHPLRVLVWLPLRRGFLWWYHFPPSDDQPLKSKLLHQPEARFVFEQASRAALVLGVLGALALAWDPRRRALALTFALALITRTIAMSWASPDGGYQRYLAPVYPLLLLLACALPVESLRATGVRDD